MFFLGQNGPDLDYLIIQALNSYPRALEQTDIYDRDTVYRLCEHSKILSFMSLYC